jgi:hypothetical protein
MFYLLIQIKGFHPARDHLGGISKSKLVNDPYRSIWKYLGKIHRRPA